MLRQAGSCPKARVGEAPVPKVGGFDSGPEAAAPATPRRRPPTAVEARRDAAPTLAEGRTRAVFRRGRSLCVFPLERSPQGQLLAGPGCRVGAPRDVPLQGVWGLQPVRSAPRRVTPLRPSRRSPQRRWAPTAFARAPAGAGAHTPSEFAVFFRVSLAVLAAHLLRRTGLDLSPLDVALAVCTPRACQVRCQTRCAPLVNFYAPSEYLGNFAPLDAPRHLEGVSRCSSSPHEVARPSSVRGSCRPLPATAAEAAAAFAAGLRPASVPTTSFLTTSPACSATNRPGISPGDAPGIHGPAGCSHSSGDTASPRCAAPPDLLDCTPDTVLTTRCPEDAEATSNQPVTPVTTTPRREPPRRRCQTRPKPRSHRFRNPPHRGDRPLHQPKPKQSQHRRTVASTFVGTTPPKKRSPRRPRGPPGVCPRTEVAEATPPRVTTSTEVKTASRLSSPKPPKRPRRPAAPHHCDGASSL